jgi:hypothetical protein
MGEARALPAEAPWKRRRRRRRGLRALPLRLLAVGSLAAVIAAGLWVADQVRAQRARIAAADVALLASGLSQVAAPGPMTGVPGALARSVDGVAFPDWRELGWRAVGLRRDVAGGRELVTVDYARRGRQLTYTIVSGTEALQITGARTVYRGSLALSFVSGPPGTTVLTFQRGGRTVLMTSQNVALARTMVRLAAWRAGGRLA